MGAFTYSPPIVGRFPGIRGGVVHAVGLGNGPSPQELARHYGEEQKRVIGDIGDTPLSEIPSLAAWRRAFTVFGVKPTQYRNAAESLLRRLTKQGEIPSINLLVDMANLVSIRHRVPVAVFDQREVTGSTVVRFASGEERFTDLGSGSETGPDPGEVIFVDDDDLVSARRWCWRQSAQSAAGPTTTEAVMTIEGQHEGADETIAAAVSDLMSLLSTHQPQARFTHGEVGPASPTFGF